MHHLPYDAYELSPVTEDARGCCETHADEAAARSTGLHCFWSLYGHLPAGGVECVGDFAAYEHAAGVYARISARPAPDNPALRQLIALPAR